MEATIQAIPYPPISVQCREACCEGLCQRLYGSPDQLSHLIIEGHWVTYAEFAHGEAMLSV